ncbi:MAG: hypothetical protein FD155_3361 [Bacteroidetes bacterium]|nr:MAG: hypothetical protein FD155_3361 [Bacteroidota bacterium]
MKGDYKMKISNSQSQLIKAHFQMQHEYREAYFKDTLSMQEAPMKLGLPFGRTTFLGILRKHKLIDNRNFPSPEMLTLGLMKFRTSKRSLDPSAIIVPLMTLSGLMSIKGFIPKEDLQKAKPITEVQNGTNETVF